MENKEVGIYLINKRKFKEYNTNDEIITKLKENIGEKYRKVELERNEINGYKII